MQPEMNDQEYASVNKIPIRATIISALSIIPYAVILAIIFASKLEKENMAMGGRMILTFLGAIRCPTIGDKI